MAAGKVGINGDRKRLHFGRWAHDAGWRLCFIELYACNLHAFVTQCHPNKFSLKKKVFQLLVHTRIKMLFFSHFRHQMLGFKVLGMV